MGQPLLPEHFEALEGSLRDEVQVRLARLGAPQFGVSRLRWDPAQLEKGELRIVELTLVLASGQILDIPGNCDVQSLDLQSLAEPPAEIQLVHIDPSVTELEGRVLRPVDRKEGILHRRIERTMLVADRSRAPAGDLFHLITFQRSLHGEWTLDPSYVPPCTGIRETPFFGPMLDQLKIWLSRFDQTLRLDVRENHLAGHQVFAAQQAMRGVFELQGWMADLSSDLNPHPYAFYTALRSFYVNVCIYRGLAAPGAEIPYDHQDLGGCFGKLIEAAGQLMMPSAMSVSSAHYVPFEKEENILVAHLPREARLARQLFVLAQRAPGGQEVDLEEIKLASPNRLDVVHRRALRGVPVQRMENPPFHHGFSSDVSFFALDPETEWNYAASERALAAYGRPELDGHQLYLYWR